MPEKINGKRYNFDPAYVKITSEVLYLNLSILEDHTPLSFFDLACWGEEDRKNLEKVVRYLGYAKDSVITLKSLDGGGCTLASLFGKSTVPFGKVNPNIIPSEVESILYDGNIRYHNETDLYSR